MLQTIVDFAKKIDQFDLSNLSFISPIGQWLDQHPMTNTIVLVVNHIFRALAMYAFISFLPGSLPVNCGIALAGSLFYRVTIERFCHFQFAIPACLGGIAIEMSKPPLYEFIRFSAHQSFRQLASSWMRLGSLALYFTAIVWLSYSSVQKLGKPKNCCGV